MSKRNDGRPVPRVLNLSTTYGGGGLYVSLDTVASIAEVKSKSERRSMLEALRKQLRSPVNQPQPAKKQPPTLKGGGAEAERENGGI